MVIENDIIYHPACIDIPLCIIVNYLYILTSVGICSIMDEVILIYLIRFTLTIHISKRITVA